MKSATFATAVAVLAAGAIAGPSDYEAPYDDVTLYRVQDFYAGSGPKSAFTEISFTISQINGSEIAQTFNYEKCGGSSGSNFHDGSIVDFPPQACNISAGGSDYYSFSFEQVASPDGYYLNITDGSLGFATLFISNNTVTRVQNNADPSQPDPLPNYQIRLPGNITFGREQSLPARP